MSVTIPKVNINGTSKKVLISDLVWASNTLNDAIVAVGETAPHGRDYLQAGGSTGEFVKARKEFQNRINRLQEIRKELWAIAEGIDEKYPDRS